MNKWLLLGAITLCGLIACGCGTAHSSSSADETLSRPAAVHPEPMVGGYHVVSVDEANVIEAAQFAVKTINARSNSLTPYTLVKILTAKSQVVAGANYAMSLLLERGSTAEVHDVVVFSQPWTHTMQLTKDVIRS